MRLIAEPERAHAESVGDKVGQRAWRGFARPLLSPWQPFEGTETRSGHRACPPRPSLVPGRRGSQSQCLCAVPRCPPGDRTAAELSAATGPG